MAEEEIETITLEDLTEMQWRLIYKYARANIDAGQFGSNQWKCAIKGFLDFLNDSGFDVTYNAEDTFTVH